MLIFPTLSTGAVGQYPLPFSYTSPVEVIRFVDGSDQRFLSRGQALRSWHIQLSFISDAEAQQLEVFFESLQGQYSTFSFPDPYSGQTVPNCIVGNNALVTDYLATDLTSASLWVVETNA